MLLRVEVNCVQHIQKASLELDLSRNGITCIVGKNGAGKTTLIRAIRNLTHSDTFLRTASKGIFNPESCISYFLGEDVVNFVYDHGIDSLNCKTRIPSHAETLCAVELAVPYGERFNFFQSVSGADLDIRRQIILEEYTQPTELIDFLSDIYVLDDKFKSLIETKVRGRSYYSILLDGSKYVREDYLSSGEFFLINLYRAIKGGARLIVVDEIDLGLDAAAQVQLLRKLRVFCQQYSCNFLITTHSLAMMRMLDGNELLYMERQGGQVDLIPASYSYIKTLLFGFLGWDRYILTEDPMLAGFLEAIIQRFCKDVFYRYKIIYIGGGSQVADLLRRNEQEKFLSDPCNVIAILDGDEKCKAHAQHPSIHFVPVASVEKAVHEYYDEEGFPYKLAPGKKFNGAKDLLHSLVRDGVVSMPQIYSYLCKRNEDTIAVLACSLTCFLQRSDG